MMNKAISAFLFVMFPLLVAAQLPLLDITLETTDSMTLHVKVRPDSAFDGLVSNVQFTIKWEAVGNVDLDMPAFHTPANLLIYPQKAGMVEEENGFRYQKFGGVGLNALNVFNESWDADQEVFILEIPVLNADSLHPGDFVISEDAKTLDPFFNGVFYAELNSQDRTGIIYDNTPSTSVDPLISALHSFDRLFPNPASDKVTLEFTLESPGEVQLTLFNYLGQWVSEETTFATKGENQLNWEVSQLPAGVYQVGLIHHEITLTQKLVVVH